MLGGGCALRGPGASAFIPQAEEALARGDDVRAFQNYAYAIDSENTAASQLALERLRASPRLQAAMEIALKDLQESTVVKTDSRADFLLTYRNRSEVRTYVRLKGLIAG